MVENKATEGIHENRSLQRGLEVLACICSAGGEGLRVADLMRRCALERATMYRLLGTLQAGGYVAKHNRYWYVPGPRCEDLSANRAIHQKDLVGKLSPVLRKVSDSTGDASFAVVKEGLAAHCIARHIGTHPIQVLAVQVGRRQPLGVGAAGLALLAALPEDEAASIVSENATDMIAYGGMTVERMLLLLKATRERGWSLVGNHVVSGVIGVGCAVRIGGKPLAAVSVAAPMSRMNKAKQALIVKMFTEDLARTFRQQSC